MKTEQQKQAENLYFQTNLSKTEIAEAVGVSRRTMHYWVQQNHWDAIRQASRSMPTLLAGNCYLILAQLQNSILSRTDAPVTTQEVNAIYKLATTIAKLNAKGAFSENLEALTHFVEFTENFDPALSADLQPVVAAYARHSAAAQQPVSFTPPPPRESPEEQQLDLEDLAAWAAEMELAGVASSPLTKTAPAHTATAGKAPTAPAAKPSTQHLNRAARRAMARAAA